MGEWEPGPGAKSALAMGLTVLVLIGIGFNRPEVADLLTKWQPLFAALVAMCAAFVAYEGATATARDQRRKDADIRQATIVTTCNLLISEAATVRQVARKTRREIAGARGNPEEHEVAEQELTRWASLKTKHLQDARENIGAYHRELREPVLRLFNAYGKASTYAKIILSKDDEGSPADLFAEAQTFVDTALKPLSVASLNLERLLQARLLEAGIEMTLPVDDD